MTPPRDVISGLDTSHHHFSPPATQQPSLTNRISLGKLLLQQPKGPLFLGALDLAGQRAGGGGGLGLGKQNGFFQPADFAGHDGYGATKTAFQVIQPPQPACQGKAEPRQAKTKDDQGHLQKLRYRHWILNSVMRTSVIASLPRTKTARVASSSRTMSRMPRF